MAIVSGPLLSLDASGKFGGVLVATRWKGRKVMRQLVTPANPMSATQTDQRNDVRVTGEAQHWANFTTLKYPSATFTDKQLLIKAAPSGQAWNGYLNFLMIGKQSANMVAADAAWTALTSPQKTAYDTAAAALTPAMTSVPQYSAGNVPGTAKSAGHVFFNYLYGLYVGGIHPVPTGTPPTYA